MDKDIKYAIDQENNYWYDLLDRRDAYANLKNYIAKAGYTDINEYNKDKEEYFGTYIKQFNYEVIEQPYISPVMPKPYFDYNTAAFLYTINCKTNYAFITNEFERYDILKKYNYEPVKLGYNSINQLILSSNKDLRIYLIVPSNKRAKFKHPLEFFKNKIKDLLSRYYDNVTIKENDIFIDNKMVCGCASIFCDNSYAFMFQINFDDKSKIIKEIFGEITTPPTYIDSNVLSQEELKNEFLSWLK